MASDGEDDDVPELSGQTLAVLQEFLKEQEERELNLATTETRFDEDWVSSRRPGCAYSSGH